MIRKLILLLCLTFSVLGVAPAWAQAKNPSFNLVNHTSQAIRELYVTPAGDDKWGGNRLTSGPIVPGASFAVRRHIDGNCVFDIRVIYADGTREERRTVDTCKIEDVAFAGPAKATTGKAADDPSFRLINHLTQPIIEVTATPTGQPRGANLLEKGALAPGANLLIHPTHGQGCAFELRLVMGDKSAKTRTLDLCKVSELSIP